MDKLIAYVAAIHGLAGPVSIVSHTTSHDRWTDDDVEVTRDETEYRFDNGAVVRRSVEQDRAPSDLLCAECYRLRRDPPSRCAGDQPVAADVRQRMPRDFLAALSPRVSPNFGTRA